MYIYRYFVKRPRALRKHLYALSGSRGPCFDQAGGTFASTNNIDSNDNNNNNDSNDKNIYDNSSSNSNMEILVLIVILMIMITRM